MLLCLTVVVSAQKFECKGIVYELRTNYGTYAYVIGYMPKINKIVIPSDIKYKGKSYSVWGIECKAKLFGVEKKVKSISLPSTLHEIIPGAFAGCSNVKSVTIPKELSFIDNKSFGSEGLFADCTSLQSVTFEADGKLTSLGEYMFHNCISLRKISLPDKITWIRNGAFKGCINLEEIQLGRKTETIGSNTFDGCKKLNDISLPSTVKSILSGAFDGCSSLTHIILPPGVSNIGGYKNCISLQTIEIPDRVKYIDSNSFENCVSLSKVVFGNGIKEIGKKTFKGCVKLDSVRLPILLKKIEEEAFEGCVAIENVVIPDSVMSIGKLAFNGCSGLRTITIPATIQSIEENAFKGCAHLSSLSVPEQMKDTDLGVSVTKYTPNCLPLEDREYFEWALFNAEQGDGEAQFRLYLCYFNGKGIAKNMRKAEEWLQKAVDNNVPAAFYSVALKKSDKNYYDKDALKLFRQAAEMGHEPAYFDVALRSDDMDEKISYYIMAADAKYKENHKYNQIYKKNLEELGIEYDPKTKEVKHITPKKNTSWYEDDSETALKNVAYVKQLVQEKKERAARRREAWLNGLQIATNALNAFNDGYNAAVANQKKTTVSKHQSTTGNKTPTAVRKSNSSQSARDGGNKETSNKKMATGTDLGNRKIWQNSYDKYAKMLMDMYYGNYPYCKTPFKMSEWNEFQSKMRSMRIEWANKNLWLSKTTRCLLYQSEWETKSPTGHK